ncbi:MAG: tetratricopeptide repeat protein [Anaerolineae bacterium]
MSTNANAMVRAGVDAYRAGNKAEARQLLERAIEVDSYNESAWLWLSAVVDTQEEQQTCLENVLIINPQSDRARQGLKSLGVDPDAILNQAQAEQSADHDEYIVPTSSASAEHKEGNTSSEEYDDWVDGLNLGNNSSAPQERSVTDDLFGDVDFSDDGTTFGLDENIFSDDTYDEPADMLVDEDIDYDQQDYDDYAFDTSYSADEGYDESFDDGDDLYAGIIEVDAFEEDISDQSDYNASQFQQDPFAPPAPEPKRSGSVEDLAPEELFALIPAEISATRASGIQETLPKFHYAILGVLGIVNLGALVFVILQFL